LIEVIVVSWLIAFFEYCFQVPANRIGYGEFTAYQLKIIQEIVTLIVFAVFAFLYLGEAPRWNYVGSFVCILGAVVFAFWGKV
ncbi:MAG: DMT family protein, partial [Candidatus Binatus sp.]